MIRYDLRCAEGHGFESWFRDSAAYDALHAAGQVACAVCGSTSVDKALMAPAVRSARRRAAEPAETAPQPMLSTPPQGPMAEALTALRAKLEAEADYVGPAFAAEARRIHEGAAERRAIWGEATGAEAKALVEDGVPVAPLPFLPRRDD
ncbi:MAG: DUF1178 family protein [Rhodobacteraceae bacterium]|nr:MAG: DUF1178 family protein [Paracoccaceae bacterium]